ncbi:hypothetical protein [Streptomyces broussonetiae]|uniref:Gram-positive cocci surface proteins LPxTG domain-containing protein n=1 Tax=Streptomyces broussonetiae TaxID=2686304 RepID=A0ABV5E855_9ACTN
MRRIAPALLLTPLLTLLSLAPTSPGTAAPAAPAAPEGPRCAPAPGTRDFPVTTRIRGGPDTYQAGGGYGSWVIDLTNTTARPCTGIHPVVVLVDERRKLTPEQSRLEFYDGAGPRPRPVRWEATDQDELVGAFDDGFPGFTVAPGRTVSVRVRLAITSDAVRNEVTATAAVVQRRGDDGDWVGQSGDYRFTIASDRDPLTDPDPERETTDGDPEPETGTGTGTGTGTTHPATPREDRLPAVEELAATGTSALPAALAAALLLTGTVALFLVRGRR